MKPVEKLFKILKDEHGLDIDIASFRVIRPGLKARQRGVWSWKAKFIGGFYYSIGSQHTVTQLLKAKKIKTSTYKHTNGMHIDTCNNN